MSSPEENEDKFDKLEERFDALARGEEEATNDAAESGAEAEYGPSVSDNERQQAAIDAFDDDGQPLKEDAENSLGHTKETSNYSTENIDDVTDKVTKWEDHLRDRWGDDTVDGWIDDLD